MYNLKYFDYEWHRLNLMHNYFQDVVYALAHATGKTGRFTLIERWRNNERLLAPQEHPLKVGQHHRHNHHHHRPRVGWQFRNKQNDSVGPWTETYDFRFLFRHHRHFFQLIFVVNQIKAKRDHETCSGVESFRPDPEIPELKNWIFLINVQIISLLAYHHQPYKWWIKTAEKAQLHISCWLNQKSSTFNCSPIAR